MWDDDEDIVERIYRDSFAYSYDDRLLAPKLSVTPIMGEQSQTVVHTLDLPRSMPDGPYFLCAEIEYEDLIPDPKEINNAVCNRLYAVSHPDIADWVHPVPPFNTAYGRVWLGTLYRHFEPKEIVYNFRRGLLSNLDSEQTRTKLYRHVALEIATRKAVALEGYLDVAGLEGIELAGATAETMEKILTVYGLTRHAKELQYGGLLPKVAEKLVRFAPAIFSAIDLAAEGYETAIAMVVNRAVRLGDAHATLDILDNLPIDRDFVDEENEWKEGIELARKDLEDMTGEDQWKAFAVAANENSRDLIAKSASFTVTTVAASGITVKGVALGAAAHSVAPFLLVLPVALTIADVEERIQLSMIAAQVYVELYREKARSDNLEALTYAKFAAYNYMDEAYDNWIERVLNIIRVRDSETLRKSISERRDAMFEEAKSHLQLTTIEFDASQYSLVVGDEIRLEPVFKSGSGKKIVGYKSTWSHQSDPDEEGTDVITIDEGVITALAPGIATVIVSAVDSSNTVHDSNSVYIVVKSPSCPYEDVSNCLLLGLTVEPLGRLNPPFSSDNANYTMVVTRSLITLHPVKDDSATLQIVDAYDNVIPDSYGDTVGYQIRLRAGVNTIKIRVTSEDGQVARTYTIEVSRVPSAPIIYAWSPGAGSLTVRWNASSFSGGADITSYDLRYIESAADETVDSNWTVVDDVWTATRGGDLKHVITGLFGEIEYDVQVRAVNAAGGIGFWSETVTGTPESSSACIAGGAVDDHTDTGLVSDCETLLVARDTLAGSGSVNWSETTPITQWDGVGLGGTPRRVTRLNLAGKGLSGTIPSVLGRLSMLTHLNLRSNDGLTGKIPSELGYLSNLRVLNLHSNSHSGSIPNLSGAVRLEELYLANNDLSGSIPTWLNGMTNMRELWLWGNKLTGSIPKLSGMTSLDKLKLANNMLTGGVPDGSMLPPNMTWLIIDGNSLRGEIPDLSSLTSLKLLWLHSNKLEGSIPAWQELPPNVDDLNLRDNDLTGEIPDLSGLDRATRVRLHGNDLSGRVPATLGDLDMLRQLWLWDNDLTSIADGLGDLADTLIEIGLNGNPWDAVACVPAALANVAKNDYTTAGIEVCSADDGS